MSGQRGFATLEFTAGVALLMIPVLLIVTLLPTWSEGHQAATTAADVGARAAATAVANRGDPVTAATAAADVVLAARGVTGEVTVDEATSERVVVSVSVALSAIPIPGQADAGAFATTARAVALVDPFRAPGVVPIQP